MKRLPILVALTLSLAVVPSIASAAERPPVAFIGTTSQSNPIGILTQRDGAVRRVREVFFVAELACPISGDTPLYNVDFGFSRHGGPALVNGAFQIDLNDSTGAVHVAGTLNADSGSGTVKFVIAQLTSDEQAEACTSGDLTWTANRHRSPLPAPSTGPSTSVTHEPWGDLTLTRMPG